MRPRQAWVSHAALLAVALTLAGGGAYGGPFVAPFAPSGLDGAGFQNVLYKDGNFLVSGADVAGFHVSVDNGQHWTGANIGLNTQLGIAAITASPDGSVFYAALGGGSGVYESTDQAASWHPISSNQSQITFSGGNNKSIPALPATHPRSTGNLLLTTDVGATDYLFAGTLQSGVWRTSNDGQNWSRLDTTDIPDHTYIRSVIGDPSDPNTVYVGTYGTGPNDGLYISTNALAAAGSVKFTPLPPPAGITEFHVEEMLKLDGTLYLAADSDGVFRYDANGWQQILAPSPSSGGKIEQYESITGYKTADGKHVIYAGGGGLDGNLPVTNRSIMRTVDAAASTVAWGSKASNNNWTNPVGGPGGNTQWWLAASNQSGCVGGASYVASQLIVKPGSNSDHDEVWSAGRGGIWNSTNGGTDWYPMMDGLMVTVNRGVVVDPKDAKRVYVCNTDWTMVQSTDRLQTVDRNKPSGADSVGFYAAFDTNTPAGQPSKLYLATADRDNNISGEVFLYDPSTSNWTDLNLGPLVNNQRPIALAVGHHAADNSTVVLAAVEQNGVWRKEGSGGWQPVLTSTASGGPLSTTNNTDGMTWLANSKIAYLADASGLWRTNDEGNTGSWLEIWNHNAQQAAANPNDPSVLYVSTQSGVYALSGIADGDTVENKGITLTTLLSGSANPAAIAVGPTQTGGMALYVACEPDSNNPLAKLLMYPISGTTLGTAVDIANDYYRATALTVKQIAVGAEGSLYVAGNDGVIAATNHNFNWAHATGGSWSILGNWDYGIPQNSGDTGNFGNVIGSASVTVTLDGNRTLSGLSFSNSSGGHYTLASGSGGTLTLANSGNVVPIQVADNGGQVMIDVQLTLQDSVAIDVGTSANLTLSGSITGTGKSLIKTGLGILTLSSTSNTYDGDTTVDAGTLKALALTSTDGTVTVGMDLSHTATLVANYIHVHRLVLNPGSVVILGAGAATDFGGNVANRYAGSTANGGANTVPEPSSFVLGTVGVVSLLACASRRRKRTASCDEMCRAES
jgi:autotransporter-associated beta strand protein